MPKSLMILGTASHAGKSTVVAALCRIFRQDGLRVAPFKAQNMALNSFATVEGHEIGRAQATQALAAGIEPHVDMNPLLLKPCSDTGSQVVLNGAPAGTLTAASFKELRPMAFRHIAAAYDRLAARYDVIVLEGAGSPVEMNLKDSDIVNLRMAAYAKAACLVVADIDRGGVFASLVGTYALLDSDERSRIAGFIVNKFRGDLGLFKPGVEFLERRLESPCYGVVPHLANPGLDEEDSVALESRFRDSLAATRTAWYGEPECLRVGVIRLPHISNFTDFRPLEALVGVDVRYLEDPGSSTAVDVLILPGSKNTIADLAWLKASGWFRVIERHRFSKPVVGICGGFQMFGREILDPYQVEGDNERASGLGFFDAVTTLARGKTVRQSIGRLAHPEAMGSSQPGPTLKGYEIHMGETQLSGCQPLLLLYASDGGPFAADGGITADGRVIGTYLHGLFDEPAGCRVLVSHWRRLCGLDPVFDSGSRVPPDASQAPICGQPAAYRSSNARDDVYDRLAGHFRANLDIPGIYRLLGVGAR